MLPEENVSLRPYTSLHVGGPARYFVHAKTDQDVNEALTFAREHAVPYLILGKGSNTLFADAGYPGVIIHMEDRTVTAQNNKVTAAAGTFMRQLINFSHAHGLIGLEELAGIPGTVGGAVRGNAGTWSTETKDYLAAIEVLKPTMGGTWESTVIPPSDCHFGYRESIFKHHPEWIILRATFTLTPGDTEEGARIVQKDVTDRHTKQPYDAPSAGSVFKNPDKARGIFSGKLIEACGLKGKRIGDAEISPKHGNFIVNRGQATSQDVLDLIQYIQISVLEKHHVTLEPEIVIVPSR